MNTGGGSAKELKKTVHSQVADASRIAVQATSGREKHQQAHAITSGATRRSTKAAVGEAVSKLLTHTDDK